MILACINADAEHHYFERDDRAGFHLVFVSRDQKTQNPFTPHWVGTCGNEESLEAMCRWTATRRDQWQVWGALAERIGAQRFAKHMDDLLKAEPMVRVEGALIQRQGDPTQVGIGEMVQGPQGLRVEVLHVHTFESAAACEAFHDWFNSDGNHKMTAGLVRIAYSAGTDELDTVLDEIASAGPKPKRGPRGRRRGSSRRQWPLAA